MPGRIATMPIGMIKDFVEGGIVGMGKNIGPRMKNIATGDSMLNHAQFIDKKAKSNLNKEQTNNENNT